MSVSIRYGAGDYLQSRQEAHSDETPKDMGAWKPFRPSENGPESKVKSDYGYGRIDRDLAAAPQEPRSFWSRTRDEVCSWFGDRSAEARRTADIAREHGFSPETQDAPDDDNDVVWHGEDGDPRP